MRFALIALTGAVVCLAGCSSVAKFREDAQESKGVARIAPKDCSKGGVGCPPLNRRQFYDDKSTRYYYFDQSSGRYYWENGDPRF